MPTTPTLSSLPPDQWRRRMAPLGSFYFLYFAFIGALAPYFPPWLSARGFDAYEVGSLMAILMLTRILAPNGWGWLADHTGQRLALIRLGSLLATLAFCALLWANGFWQTALCLAVFSAFWNAVLPQFEVLTLSALQEHRGRYSQIRLWGSIGFVVAVNGLGVVFLVFPLGILAGLMTLLLVLLTVNAWLLKAPAAPPRRAHFSEFLKTARQPAVMLFLIVILLVQVSFGPYYTFFSITLERLGYSTLVIAWLWTLGVLAEILLFTRMHHLLARFTLQSLLTVALLLTVIRWFGIAAAADHTGALLLLQLLHAASFGIVHACSIEFVHRVFHGRQEGQGQALYSAVSFGAGGAVGAWLSGLLYTAGGPALAFGIAGVIVALAAALTRLTWARRSTFWQLPQINASETRTS